MLKSRAVAFSVLVFFIVCLVTRYFFLAQFDRPEWTIAVPWVYLLGAVRETLVLILLLMLLSLLRMPILRLGGALLFVLYLGIVFAGILQGQLLGKPFSFELWQNLDRYSV